MVRIIPRLDIKGPNVVKGIHLEGLRVIGQPGELAKYYYEAGADELFFMDVVASLYDRNSLDEIISRTAQEIFIPLTVGGGLRSIEDMSRVLHAGADKVCLNTAVIKNPEIIREAARTFGSSTIVIAIEAIKEPNGTYLAYTDNGREHTGVEVFDWAKKVEALGAGEIVVTSVDREGTGRGFDLDLVGQIARNSTVPIIAHGGAGANQDLVAVVNEAKADAVAVASIFHYHYLKHYESGSASDSEGNIEFLNKRASFGRFETSTIRETASEMSNSNICVRCSGNI